MQHVLYYILERFITARYICLYLPNDIQYSYMKQIFDHVIHVWHYNEVWIECSCEMTLPNMKNNHTIDAHKNYFIVCL